MRAAIGWHQSRAGADGAARYREAPRTVAVSSRYSWPAESVLLEWAVSTDRRPVSSHRLTATQSSRLAVELSWPAQGHPASVVKRYMLARALCWSSRLVLASTGFTCF